MNHTVDVAVIVGSLRKESWTRKVARALAGLAPPQLKLTLVEIGELPHYNQDLEEHAPPAWTAFRERIARADAVLFCTPEYNRSVPGVLKNAIDVGSRPKDHNAWNGKPAAVVSVSPGALGAFGAAHHLRQTLVFINMPAMAMPEVYLSNVAKLFDASGTLTNDSTREFLGKFLQAFAGWIERLAPHASVTS